MAGKKITLIFDLDGTLIDSLEDIAVCMNKVLKTLNIPTYEINEYKKFVGGGVKTLVDNALKNYDEDIKNKVVKEFKIVYEHKLQANTKPYDGIYELLKKLDNPNYNLAILSNKPHKFTIEYVQTLFGEFNFKEIHGQKNDIPKKPNPKAALNIVKALHATCEDSFFIGDSDVDMQTAKNANIKAIGVSWGFRDEKELIENGADFIVSHPLDIFEIVKKA